MEDNETKTETQKEFSAWALAWELGYQISLPLILFTLLGRFADRSFGTSPWLLLSGILLSIIITTYLVYRKVKNLLK